MTEMIRYTLRNELNWEFSIVLPALAVPAAFRFAAERSQERNIWREAARLEEAEPAGRA